jgi:hypothetical protein
VYVCVCVYIYIYIYIYACGVVVNNAALALSQILQHVEAQDALYKLHGMKVCLCVCVFVCVTMCMRNVVCVCTYCVCLCVYVCSKRHVYDSTDIHTYI